MNKTLVVDDSSTMRRIISRILRQSGISVETVLEAAHGLEALEQVVSNPNGQLVLTDVDMPEMDGIELVHKVREHHSNADLPIIMITTEGGDQIRDRAMSGGANGHLSQPFTPETSGHAPSSHVK